MSLSTQLARGALALPMLLAFAGLGLVASQRADAERANVPTVALEQAEAISRLARATEAAELARLTQAAAIPALERLSKLCDAPGRARVLLLAQAPADLGNLAIRWRHSCRG